MRYRASDKTEAFHRAARLARQADHQRFVHDRRKAARQNRVASDLDGFHPHRFAKPGQLAFGNVAHGFGRHVAQRDAGATGGQDQMTAFGDLLANGALDIAFFVRDEVLGEDAPAVLFRRLLQRRTAEVVIETFRCAVGDGDDANVNL